MRMTHVVPLTGAMLGVALGAAACGSSTGTNTVTMTQAEVTEVFTEMSAALDSAGTGISFSRMPAGVFVPRAAASATGSATSISASAPCSGGGTVGVSGNVNSSTTGGSFNLTETATSCQTTHFTVGGSVNISGSVTSSQSSGSFNMDFKGSFTVTRLSDGTSGNCVIDFSLNGSFSSTSSSVTAQGTICGVNASGLVTT